MVTGASSGMGAATAHGLATRGASVTVVARRQHGLAGLREDILGSAHREVIGPYTRSGGTGAASASVPPPCVCPVAPA
ncbi:SDR family NAD(P)-dependent oxidoreductase [Streptomyces sp. NBC_00400]|uniref:SDR family NAD(P)-dependent oxidoreductase n=1 Tax=Streptomyces sp. NBC_00400 TaxID=2975737 RepID=UPI003FA7D997